MNECNAGPIDMPRRPVRSEKFTGNLIGTYIYYKSQSMISSALEMLVVWYTTATSPVSGGDSAETLVHESVLVGRWASFSIPLDSAG